MAAPPSYVTHRNELGIFSVFSNEEYILRALERGEPWEKELIRRVIRLIPSASDVLDIGSHVGTHSIPYAAKCRRVYAFEAQAPIYSLLLHNICQNGITNIVPYHTAIGAMEGVCSLTATVPDGRSAGEAISYASSTKPINYGGMQLGAGGATVGMITIDSMNLSNVGYMKVDVEGAEPLVFYGARETIKRCRPVILYERNWKVLSSSTFTELKATPEMAGWDVSAYCATLGYTPAIPISIDGDFLLLPSNDITTLGAMESKDVKYVADEKTGYHVLIGTRGPFPIYCYQDWVILLCHDDPMKIHMGRYERADGSITWDNGTKWTR